MRILFPTDFSPSAQNAYRYAIGLANDTGAKIDFIHVYSSSLKPIELYLSIDEIRKVKKQEQQEKEQKMNDFVNQYKFDKVGAKLVYPGIFIHQEIVEHTRKGVDLVVMGTKGERNPINKLMGSVTTRLMMNAVCPVLAIPSNATYNGIKQITYATAFNPNDEHFLVQLEAFSKKMKAKISFLHITDNPRIEIEEDLEFASLSSDIYKFFIISNPSPMEGVNEFIQSNPTDLIAMYIPKRTLWEQLFHTSFSKKMTFHTDVPLFVYHE